MEQTFTLYPQREVDCFDLKTFEPVLYDIAGPAYAALQAYGERIHDSTGDRTVMHPVRVCAILRDFTDAHVDPRAYSGALLHDIGQRVRDEFQGKNAKQALKAFSKDLNVSQSDWEYVSTLLADLDMVEDYSEAIRAETEGQSHELATILKEKHSTAKIPVWMWNADSWVSDPTKMLELAQNVNIETILIKASEMYDNLKYPAPKEASVLQDIFDAESFYAPLCEIMGFDGQAMALRSAAAQIRLERGGNTAVLTSAQELLMPLSDRRFLSGTIGGILTSLIGGTSLVEHVVDNESQHDIIIGESLLQDPVLGESQLIRAVWRLKSLGSTALKMAKGRPVPDTVGITLITDTVTQLASVYNHLVNQIHNGIEAGKLLASDEEHPMDVRGGDEFLGGVLNALNIDSPVANELSSQRTTNGYQVAKMTMKYVVSRGDEQLAIPVEIQLQTEDDRLHSRVGHASHIAYKARGREAPKIDFDVRVLEQIRERKQEMRTRTRGELVEGSFNRATSFRVLIRNASLPQPNLPGIGQAPSRRGERRTSRRPK